MLPWRVFDQFETASVWLADAVAQRLRDAIALRGRAGLVVSGGRTPGAFFDALARQELDWALVTVTLADERCVPRDHPDSNEKMVRARLLAGEAAAANFVSLQNDDPDPDRAAGAAAHRIAAVPRPWDVTVLGMGEDGHTASLFPGGDVLAKALAPGTATPVVAMRAPGASQSRLTLTAAELDNTRALFVHIAGPAKRRVLEAAFDVAPAPPIAVVLRSAPAEGAIVWSPEEGGRA
jgi:6-phosphogluconolactonase